MAAQDVNPGLGTPNTRYEGNGPVMVGFVMLMASLVLGGLILSSGLSTLSEHPNDPDAPLFSAFGILIIIIAFIVFYLLSKRRSGLYVQIYRDGLVRAKGNHVETVRWDEIDSVWQKVVHIQRYGQTISTQYIYTLETSDKRKLKFSNEIKDIAGLGQAIQVEVSNRRIPKMMEAYNNGETLKFGSLSVSKQGVMQGRKSLEWAEIEGAQINNGFVTFKKQGKWFNWARVSASKIPNLPSFLALIDHVVGVKARR